MPLSLVDGSPATSIAVDDRGLAYGDGVFETIRVIGGQAILLDEHLERLMAGLDRLSIPAVELPGAIHDDLDRVRSQLLPDAVIKVTVTRGSGGRGYGPPVAAEPRRILQVSPYVPDADAWQRGIAVGSSDIPLGINPALAGIKHLARLEQVLGAAMLPDHCHEAIVTDTEGRVVEGIKSNLFIAVGSELATPRLDRCGVAGVMRRWICESVPSTIEDLSPTDLASADEIFFCNSVFGVFPVRELDLGGEILRFGDWPVTRSLQAQLVDELGFRIG